MRLTNKVLAFAVSVVATWFPAAARASECVDTTPEDCQDVCTLQTHLGTANAAVSCDLEVNGSTSDPYIVVITNVGDATVEAFGTDAAGLTFCCILPLSNAATAHHVAVTAGTRATTADYTYDDGITTWELENVFGTTPLRSVYIGSTASDIVTGSDVDSVYFNEELDDGDDTVDGRGGDDEIYGGFGDDTLTGGDGDDIIWGASGDDTISGGAGNDELYGEDPFQQTSAQGKDTINGGAGADLICTGGTTGTTSATREVANGDGGNDTIWGARHPSDSGGADNATINGGSNTDTCDGAGSGPTPTNCEGSSSSMDCF